MTTTSATPTNIHIHLTHADHPTRRTDKSRVVAALLAAFFGGFGIHKFYLGRPGMGLLYLVFVWTLIPTLVAICESWLYLLSSREEFHRKYVRA